MVMVVRNGYLLHSHRYGPLDLNPHGCSRITGKSSMQMTVADHIGFSFQAKRQRRGGAFDDKYYICGR